MFGAAGTRAARVPSCLVAVGTGIQKFFEKYIFWPVDIGYLGIARFLRSSGHC